ncbi:MAG: hypothetical protein IJW54_01090 [Clostridia bacterium]|nr:hypothetical protein [Clostridia bacterium]
MNEVFIVYGRMYWNEAVFDHDGNYFGESQIIDVFESYESAIAEFKKCVQEAYDYVCDCPPWVLNDDLIEVASTASPFEDYNMGKDEYDEGDIQWIYEESEGENACWQMYAVNIDISMDECPILPAIYLQKQKLKP